MILPSSGTLKSASQAINRIVRLIGSPTSSGSRYDGWLPAMITAPSSGTFSTPWCSTENRTRNSGRAINFMVEKSIGLVTDSGAGLYADPSQDAMRAGSGSDLSRPRMRALPDDRPS